MELDKEKKEGIQKRFDRLAKGDAVRKGFSAAEGDPQFWKVGMKGSSNVMPA